MSKNRTKRPAMLGVAEHGNSAILVTVASGGELIDRRRIDDLIVAMGKSIGPPWQAKHKMAAAAAIAAGKRPVPGPENNSNP